MSWTGKLWKFNTTPDDVDMNALQADITAKADGDVGAPKNKLASMDVNSVDTAELVAASVNQSKIPTAIGEVSAPFSLNATLPGGEYGFYPQNRVSSTGITRGGALSAVTGINDNSYLTKYGIVNISGSGTGYVQQRYITASPPYDLGDGECYLFIFCLLDKASKDILGAYVAPDAPWHNNGPTNIAEYNHTRIVKSDEYDYTSVKAEVAAIREMIRSGQNISSAQMDTLKMWMAIISQLPLSGRRDVPQSVKQADMPLVPHPFPDKTDDQEVVLLDPVSALSRQLLDMQQRGQSICLLIHNGFFVISSSALSRVTPPGVKTVSYRWK